MELLSAEASEVDRSSGSIPNFAPHFKGLCLLPWESTVFGRSAYLFSAAFCASLIEINLQIIYLFFLKGSSKKPTKAHKPQSLSLKRCPGAR